MVNAGAKRRDAAAGLRPGDAGLGSLARGGLVRAAGVIPAHVDHVALTLAVASIRVGRGNEESVLGAVGNLELEGVAGFCPLVPEFRDFHQFPGNAVGDALHACPRLDIVEGAAVACGSLDIRHGVSEQGGVIGACPCGGAGAVPLNAVNFRARNLCHRNRERRSFGGSVFCIRHRNFLFAHGIEHSRGTGETLHVGCGTVGIGGLNDHSGWVEAVPVLITGFGRLRSDGDALQSVRHGNRLFRRFGNSALGISDSHTGRAVRQRPAGFYGISRGDQRCPVGVSCLHHHARRVKALAHRIGGFRRWRGDGDAHQLDAASRDAAHGTR